MGDLALQAVAHCGELFSDFAQHVLIPGLGYLCRLGWWALLRVLDENAGNRIRSLAQSGGDDASFAVTRRLCPVLGLRVGLSLSQGLNLG